MILPARVIARTPFKGIGTQRFEFPEEVMTELCLFNDFSGPITFQTHYLREQKAWFTYTIQAGDVFDERLRNFQAITVVAPEGAEYNGWVRHPVYKGSYDRAYPDNERLLTRGF